MFRLESDDLVLSSSNFGLNPDQFGSMHVQYSNYEQFVDSNSALSSKRIKNIANGNGTGTETGTGTSTGINDENTGDGYDFFNLNDNGYGNIEKKVIFFIICYSVNLCIHFFIFIFLFFIFYFLF